MWINIQIKCKNNNVFLLISSLDNKIKKMQTIGMLNFKNKNKRIPEAFFDLIKNAQQFVISNNLFVHKIKLVAISMKKIEYIQKHFQKNNLAYCKIVEKISYNGCRLKKKRSKKNLRFKLQRDTNNLLTIL
jgi:ribosomal protein S11